MFSACLFEKAFCGLFNNWQVFFSLYPFLQGIKIQGKKACQCMVTCFNVLCFGILSRYHVILFSCQCSALALFAFCGLACDTKCSKVLSCPLIIPFPFVGLTCFSCIVNRFFCWQWKNNRLFCFCQQVFAKKYWQVFNNVFFLLYATFWLWYSHIPWLVSKC